MAIRKIQGNQHTVRLHVDDILSSNKVNDEFRTWLESKFGKLKHVTVSRGKIHKFLGVTSNFTEKGKSHMTQETHAQDIIDNFPGNISKHATAASPAEMF